MCRSTPPVWRLSAPSRGPRPSSGSSWCWSARWASRSVHVPGPAVSAVTTTDYGFQLGGQLGDEMLPVPGGLGFSKDKRPGLLRQMRPGRDHGRPQPAHQALVLGGIAKLLVFHERHARAPSFSTVDG